MRIKAEALRAAKDYPSAYDNSDDELGQDQRDYMKGWLDGFKAAKKAKAPPKPTQPEKLFKEWTDPETKLTWSVHEIGPNNHQQALDYAKSVGLRLATKEELELAEKHGFRKHLRITKGWLWSSSVHANYADYAYALVGFNGYIYYDYRNYYYNVNAAVLVSP